MIDVLNKVTRRHFLGASTVTAAGLGIGLGGCASNSSLRGYAGTGGKTQKISGESTVQLVKNKDRRQAVYDSLKPMQSEVKRDIGTKQVIIKVNAGFPSENHRIHSTYPEQIQGILDFLAEFHEGEVLISEGVGSSKSNNIFDGFTLFGYDPVVAEFKNAKLVDANATPVETKWIRQAKQHPTSIDIIKMYFDPNNYIISAAMLKTHNAVVGTYSLKNIVMGSPIGNTMNGGRSQKGRMHGGRGAMGGRELSYNIFTLALAGVYPDLAVVDGTAGIEGDGPWDGTSVDHQIVVASTDFVACDRICTEIAGFDPFYMKYLEWCGDAGLGNWDMENIRVAGADLKANTVQYEMHPRIEGQVAWIHENFERE
ncbi:DUF362 domain-containing protein [Candidatus Latescibacterota bacterium]